MEFKEVMNQLANLGTEQTRKIYKNHGADIDMYGVSIANLKKVLKPIKKDFRLGFQLLNSANVDAIYMSQWMVDSDMLTINDLEKVLDTTNYYMIIDNVIPQIAIRNLALTYECISSWISHSNHIYRQAAYTLYALLVGVLPDDELDLVDIRSKLDYISINIHSEENRVRYSMNSFVISVGIYIKDLTEIAKFTANTIGKVKVTMGKTSCKVPFAPDYIKKVENMNRIGRKRQ